VSAAAPGPGPLGRPRRHLREVGSTNDTARGLAASGAPHGTTVTARAQSAGHGRQGRVWHAPPGRALTASVVLREWPALLPLAAAVAVADEVGEPALVKWPNDVLVEGRKVAGILVEGRPQEHWMVLGIGLNVAVREEDLPEELRGLAAGLGREPEDVEPTLSRLLVGLERALALPASEILEAFRARDALNGNDVGWEGGSGVAEGIDDAGRLRVRTDSGQVVLDAGEVHLRR
jgi:BirA family biotin operon repressor/biotin-[acetyl-CoA-carboxylase] ligase